MPPTLQRITVFGGSGFVGRALVVRLLRQGVHVRLCVRSPNLALPLKVAAAPGQLELRRLDVVRADDKTLTHALRDSDAVVNLCGALEPRRRLAALHERAPARLAQTAARLRIKRFVHVSALGAAEGAAAGATSHYARTKYAGEQAVREHFPQSTIARPSLILGRADAFGAQLGTLARWLPMVPLFGGGAARVQPLGVDDVARALQKMLAPSTPPKIYELGGKDIVTIKTLVERFLKELNFSRALVPVPFAIARALTTFTRFAPQPLRLTPDQLRLLCSDNIVSQDAIQDKRTLGALGITAQPLSTILRQSAARFQKI